MQPRVRFNAKARSSHKKKAKRGKDRPEALQGDQVDPNAEIVVPKSEEEKEREKKLKMREEVRLHASNVVLTCSPVPLRLDARRVELESEQQEKEATGQVHCACMKP